MSLLPLRVLVLPLALLALAGCGREPAPDAAAPAGPPLGQVVSPAQGEDFKLTWLGVLPCADCDGIQSRLVLSGDGRRRHYLLEETYLGDEGENRFQQQGDWVEESTEIAGEASVVYRLDPQGPGRWFRLLPDGSLEMLEAEGRLPARGLDYRLQRL